MSGSYWVKSGLFTFFEKASFLIFGFGSFFFLVRIFPDKEEFGVWALFLTVTTLVEFTRVGLIQNAVVKYVSTSTEEEAPRIISTSLFLNILLTCISVVVLLVSAKLLSVVWHKPIIEPMVYWYVITTVALIPFSQFNYIQQAMLDFKSVFYSSFVRQGTNFVFVLIVYVFGLKIDLINLVNIQSLGAVLGSVVAFLLIRKKVKFSFVFDSAWMKKLLNYGVFTMGTNVSAILLKSVDQWIVAGKLESTAPVAVLNVCARIFNLFEVPVTTVATIVFPQSAKRVAEQGLSAAKDLYEKSVALMLAIVLPGAVIGAIVPGYILYLVAGEKYMENSIVLQFTMIQVLLLPLQRQFGTILDSIGKPKVNFVFTILTMVLNLGLNFVFVSYWGFMGSVYATSISYMVSVIGMLICLKAIIGIEVLNVFRFIPESYQKLLGIVMKK